MTYARPIARKEFVSDLRTLPVASPPPRSLGGRLIDLGRLALLAWNHGRLARSSARALTRLNDHQLRDIGINRGSIPEVARAAAWAHLTVAGLDHTSRNDARR
jgi:uncharacterized protein YjiS (DUF1127 family)